MSDSDFEDSQCTGRSDLDLNFPHYSLVDSRVDITSLGVNENINPNLFSANQTQNRAMVIGDSNISGPASNTGISVCYAPPRGTGSYGSYEGEEFLESPTQTTPQSKPPSFLPFHCGWSMGPGRGMERGGAKNSTIVPSENKIILLFC